MLHIYVYVNVRTPNHIDKDKKRSFDKVYAHTKSSVGPPRLRARARSIFPRARFGCLLACCLPPLPLMLLLLLRMSVVWGELNNSPVRVRRLVRFVGVGLICRLPSGPARHCCSLARPQPSSKTGLVRTDGGWTEFSWVLSNQLVERAKRRKKAHSYIARIRGWSSRGDIIAEGI